jgi:hypothetical protein
MMRTTSWAKDNVVLSLSLGKKVSKQRKLKARIVNYKVAFYTHSGFDYGNFICKCKTVDVGKVGSLKFKVNLLWICCRT